MMSSFISNFVAVSAVACVNRKTPSPLEKIKLGKLLTMIQNANAHESVLLHV